MANKVNIPLTGASVNIVRNCGPVLSDILQNKFGCTAIVEDVAFQSVPTFETQKTAAPEKRFAGELQAGVKLSVWKNDLTNINVDAVVNAANTKLQHYGGLALALSRSGGPQIQQDSNDYVRRRGPLKTGDAIVCTAGALPCNKIIHAVGPCLPPNPSNYDISEATPLLQKTIRSILDMVNENRLKSVAIPAISSGLFNFPLKLCADIIVSTVKEYYERSHYGTHLPVEILLVNNDNPTVNEMERACCELLSPTKYSRGAGAAESSTPTVQIGNVLLTLKWGQIEEQETDVIVNSASADGHLNSGAVSKALLKKAGNKLQQEMRQAKRDGDVIATKGYDLQCKEVFHILCSTSPEVIYRSVLQCLCMAVSRKHRSITFPAIGTGALGLSKTQVAQVMTNAVEEFTKKFPGTLEIHFVIFPSDRDTYKAFEDAMRSLQRGASNPGFTQALEQRDYMPVSKPGDPQISLHGSPESMLEAQRWLQGLFKSFDTVTIRNNFIQHFGEQEYLQLTRLLDKTAICIEESLNKGHAHIVVKGESLEDVVAAALQVEAMLCDIQREFVREEERVMLPFSSAKVTSERTPVDKHLFSGRSSDLQRQGLCMIKLEKVENRTLGKMFEAKKKQLQCFSPRTMFQRIPAQFCEMVSHIGFHAAYAPPADPAYGEGIYFAGTVRKAMEVWRELDEEFVYLVEAEVLTGRSTPGRPGLIVPAEGTTLQMFDSASGGRDLSVIFSGYQALPKYIITCKVSRES